MKCPHCGVEIDNAIAVQDVFRPFEYPNAPAAAPQYITAPYLQFNTAGAAQQTPPTWFPVPPMGANR